MTASFHCVFFLHTSRRNCRGQLLILVVRSRMGTIRGVSWFWVALERGTCASARLSFGGGRAIQAVCNGPFSRVRTGTARALAASPAFAVLTRMSIRTLVVTDDTLTTRCYESRGTQLFINNERFEIHCTPWPVYTVTITILFSKESPCYHDHIPSQKKRKRYVF